MVEEALAHNRKSLALRKRESSRFIRYEIDSKTSSFCRSDRSFIAVGVFSFLNFILQCTADLMGN